MKKLYKILLIVVLFTHSLSGMAQINQFRIVDGIPHLPVFANTASATGVQSGGVIYSQVDQMGMIYNGTSWDNLCSTVVNIAGNDDYFKIVDKIPYLPVAANNPVGVPEIGNTYYSTNQLTTLVYDGNSWVKIGDLACSGSDAGVTTKKGSFKFPALPTSPVGASVTEGAIYINTSENIFKVYNGTAWIDGVSCGWIEFASPLASSEWGNTGNVPITWTAAPDGSTYDLFYSLDGGSTWISIVNNHSGFTYNWDITGIAIYENDVKIRIHDDSYDFDGLSGLFEIYPPFVVNIARTGSGPICESLDPGSFDLTITGGSGSYIIQWYENDDNDLSSDATAVGTDVTTYDPTGAEASYLGTSHTHYVGAIVSDDNLTSMSREVEESFAFEATCLEITAPLASAEWVNNIAQTISWTETTNGSTYDLSYSIDSGTSWTVIANNVSGASYAWTPSLIIAYENDVKIRIHDDVFNHDVESDLFTVYPPYVVSIARTGSGPICESLDPGSFDLTITGGSGSYTIQWYEDDDNDLSSDATAVGAGLTTYDPTGAEASYLGTSHTHYVGAIVSDDNVSSISNREVEVSFAFEATCLEITAPLAGAEWNSSEEQTVSWTAPAGGSTYDILYSTDGGTTWIPFALNQTGNSYSFTYPIFSYQNNMKIKIHDDVFSTDTESDVFKVYEPLVATLTRPDDTGDICEDLDPGSFAVSITGGSGSNSIQWYEDDDDDLSADATAVGTGANTYDPAIMHADFNSSSHTHYTGLVVTDNTLTAVSDEKEISYNYEVSCIQLTAPIAGTSWTNNGSHAITWVNSVGSSTYKLEYSDDDGVNWSEITASTTATSYNWVPSAIAVYNTNVRVRLTDLGTSKQVVSDAFSVYPPITVSVSHYNKPSDICAATDPGRFTVSISGGSGDYTIQWKEHSNSSLISGVDVGDGTNAYNPTSIYSSYQSTNHTHYVGVVVIDNELTSVTKTGYKNFVYKKTCWVCNQSFDMGGWYASTRSINGQCWMKHALKVYQSGAIHRDYYYYDYEYSIGFGKTSTNSYVTGPCARYSGWRVPNYDDYLKLGSSASQIIVRAGSYGKFNGVTTYSSNSGVWLAYDTGRLSNGSYGVKYISNSSSVNIFTSYYNNQYYTRKYFPIQCVMNLP